MNRQLFGSCPSDRTYPPSLIIYILFIYFCFNNSAFICTALLKCSYRPFPRYGKNCAFKMKTCTIIVFFCCCVFFKGIKSEQTVWMNPFPAFSCTTAAVNMFLGSSKLCLNASCVETDEEVKLLLCLHAAHTTPAVCPLMVGTSFCVYFWFDSETCECINWFMKIFLRLTESSEGCQTTSFIS